MKKKKMELIENGKIELENNEEVDGIERKWNWIRMDWKQIFVGMKRDKRVLELKINLGMMNLWKGWFVNGLREEMNGGYS